MAVGSRIRTTVERHPDSRPGGACEYHHASMTTVFLVGAGIHQRRAVRRAHELGLQVVAVDGSPDAAALPLADHGYVVDFNDREALAQIGRKHGVQGVLTVSADRAVPVVAAVAELLGLPGIGSDTAFHMKNKVAMRTRLAQHGVPQPPFAGARSAADVRAALLGPVGFPAVVKPSDSGGQRGVFFVESMVDADRHAAEAISESPTGEAIVEGFMPGMELNGIVIARGGEAFTLTLSDRRRPPGAGFAVGWMHLYPPSLPPEQVEEADRVARTAATALGLKDGIAFPQLIARPDGSVQVVEVAARIPGGQMADLVRHATGVDLLEVALRQCLGEEIPDELCRPRFRQPLCIRFLTAEPGPLKAGRVTRIGSMDAVLAAPGVVQAELYFGEGELIRPVQVDADRRGYVIATGDDNMQALARGEAAALLFDLDVEPVVATSAHRCDFGLAHYRELIEAAKAGGYRFALFDHDPQPGDLLLRHDVDFSLDAALAIGRLDAELGARATFFLMRDSLFYNLASPEGAAAIAELRALGHAVGLHASWGDPGPDPRLDPVLAWHNPPPGQISEPVPGLVNVMEPRFALHYRSESNQRWRHGCPLEELRAGELPWLQLLAHPEIWVYPGASMKETVHAMLDAERERRLAWIAADRVDLS